MTVHIEHLGKRCTVSKLDGEYRVKLYIFNVYQKDADYFDTSKSSAYSTARCMLGLPNLTLDQTQALEEFKSHAGRRWRNDLNTLFATGKDERIPLLRQIRNSIGSLEFIVLPSED